VSLEVSSLTALVLLLQWELNKLTVILATRLRDSGDEFTKLSTTVTYNRMRNLMYEGNWREQRRLR